MFFVSIVIHNLHYKIFVIFISISIYIFSIFALKVKPVAEMCHSNHSIALIRIYKYQIKSRNNEIDTIRVSLILRKTTIDYPIYKTYFNPKK
jgi:hypothetical protein